MRRLGIAIALSSALLAQVEPAQPPSPPPQEGTGLISGTVVNQITAAPIKKATVRLAGPGPVMVAVTDAGGRFHFRALPEGQYWLNTDREDFTAPEPAGGIQPLSIRLASGEQKTGIEIPLIPLGRISGRLVDEYGAAAPNCVVSPQQYDYQMGVRRLIGRSAASTNDRGEYRLTGLRPGRYYVFLRCHSQAPAPHPLLPPGDPRVPLLVFPPQYYPGVPDVPGAARVTVAAGGDVKGIDFQVRQITGFTVSGTVRVEGDRPAPGDRIGVRVIPQSGSIPPEWLDYGAGIEPDTANFNIAGVPSGSYVLTASTFGEGPQFAGSMPIEVGRVPPEPVQLRLSPGAEVSGVIEIEHPSSGANPAAARVGGVFTGSRRSSIAETDQAAGESARPRPEIAVVPLGSDSLFHPPRTTAAKDGAFTLSGVGPGRWRLNVWNIPGNITSFTIGDQQVSPYSFEIGPEKSGAWRIVVGFHFGQLETTVADARGREPGSVSVLVAPEDLQYLGAGLESMMSPDSSGKSAQSLRPGRYRVCAVEKANAWALIQRVDIFRALESRCEIADVQEGQTAKVNLGLVGTEELNRVLEENE